MHERATHIHDVAGIGIGPFNLGLAALAAPIDDLDAVFIDDRRVRHLQQDAFALGGGGQVRRRHHQMHARQLAGCVQVDARDAGMGEGGADESHMQGARQFDVVGETALAGEKVLVLDPLDRLADHLRRHRLPPIPLAAASLYAWAAARAARTIPA